MRPIPPVPTCCAGIDPAAPLMVTYSKPKPYVPRIESIAQLVSMEDPPTTRHQRARHGLKLVGVRYTDKPIGRNTYVTLSSGDGRPVKFKRTAVYRLGRR